MALLSLQLRRGGTLPCALRTFPTRDLNLLPSKTEVLIALSRQLDLLSSKGVVRAGRCSSLRFLEPRHISNERTKLMTMPRAHKRTKVRKLRHGELWRSVTCPGRVCVV